VTAGNVLHLFKFVAAREDFTALVERASKPATPTFLSALRAAHPFWLRLRRFVLHLFKFFAAREDFTALVERASKPATPTFLSALRAAHPFWLRLRRFVLHLFKFFVAREDFIALVERASKPATPTFLSALRNVFQPALAGCEGSLSARRSRLRAAAGKIAQCHIVFPIPGMLQEFVGRTPWSARDALVPQPEQRYQHPAKRQQADGGVGRSPGGLPTINAGNVVVGKLCGTRRKRLPHNNASPWAPKWDRRFRLSTRRSQRFFHSFSPCGMPHTGIGGRVRWFIAVAWLFRSFLSTAPIPSCTGTPVPAPAADH
jgi:hypothetical protein